MRFLLLLLIIGLSIKTVAQPFDVGRTSTTLFDPSRNNRSIPVEIFYPAASAGNNVPVGGATGEKFPLIVFGHGFSMNFDPYENFWTHLVPQGYIIVFPKTEIGPIPFPDHAAFALDLSFTGQYLLATDTITTSPFFGKISGKNAIMGHSMGGGCSMLAAAQSSHISAMALFAPAETNVSAIAAAASVTIPALIFAGGKDCVTPKASNQQPMYNNLASACKTIATITNGMHCYFANSNFTCSLGESSCQLIASINRADQHAAMFAILDPWLRFNLKTDCASFSAFENVLNTNPIFTFEKQCQINAPAPVVASSGPLEFCDGESVDLSTSPGFQSYLWSTGETSSEISVTNAGSYAVIVTDSNGCTGTSDTIDVQVLPNPQAGIGILLPHICEGVAFPLTAVPYDMSYLWSTGDTVQQLDVTVDGSYSVTVTDSNGCSGFAGPHEVFFGTMPAQPVISQNDSSLFTQFPGQLHSWTFNGGQVVGVTDNVLLFPQPGEYMVKVWSDEGCGSEWSDPFLITSVTSTETPPAQVFYNPQQQQIIIKSQGFTIQKVEVFDLFGRKNFITKNQNLPGGNLFISVDGSAPGLKLIRILTPDNQVLHFRILVY